MTSASRPGLVCVQGDLTLENVDAIVNAANKTLRGGGGVDGAIHRAAGPGLLAECMAKYPSGCNTGEACITAGHRLQARYVIHTVGPVYDDGTQGEADLLAACYRNSTALAVAHGVKTIAFPAISTGAFGYPLGEAAEIALRTLRTALAQHDDLRQIRLVLFQSELHSLFVRTLTRLEHA